MKKFVAQVFFVAKGEGREEIKASSLDEARDIADEYADEIAVRAIRDGNFEIEIDIVEVFEEKPKSA